jgi:hypothetical protein
MHTFELVFSIIRDGAITLAALGTAICGPWLLAVLREQRDAVKEQVRLVKEQVNLKEAEAAALRATVSSLERQTAPALAADVDKMSSLLDRQAEERQALQKQVGQLTGERAELAKRARLAGIAVACVEGAAALSEVSFMESLRVTLSGKTTSNVLDHLREKVAELFEHAAAASSGREPSFPNSTALEARLKSVKAAEKQGDERSKSAFYGE